jgi:hypothetical protein
MLGALHWYLIQWLLKLCALGEDHDHQPEEAGVTGRLWSIEDIAGLLD